MEWKNLPVIANISRPKDNDVRHRVGRLACAAPHLASSAAAYNIYVPAVLAAAANVYNIVVRLILVASGGGLRMRNLHYFTSLYVCV
jgi:hypothetical protein